MIRVLKGKDRGQKVALVKHQKCENLYNKLATVEGEKIHQSARVRERVRTRTQIVIFG